MAAFYDDSGGFGPDAKEKFACFGMAVVPAQYIRECNDAWWGMLDRHFQNSGLLQIKRIEVKSSELHNMFWHLEKKTQLNDIQQKMFEYGLNTAIKVNNLAEAVWGFLAKPPIYQLSIWLWLLTRKKPG